jgi:hypothetical protein
MHIMPHSRLAHVEGRYNSRGQIGECHIELLARFDLRLSADAVSSNILFAVSSAMDLGSEAPRDSDCACEVNEA